MHIEQTEDVRELRETLGGILDHHGRRWQRYILSILRNPADAEDVVQEAVRRLLDRNISFGTETDVRQYLGRAILNTALELYNTRKREHRMRIPVMHHALMLARLPNPYECIAEREEAIEREDLKARLQEVLARIPRKQIEALRLTIIEPASSIRDIGMNHGIAYSTLRHRSRQGIRSLRRHLRVPSGRIRKKN